MRRLLLLAVLSIAAILSLAPTAALAQGTRANEVHAKEEAALLDCSDFATRTGVKALFKPGDDRFDLDRDGNGVACEARNNEATEDGTKLGAETHGDLDCIDFPSQKAAQAHLRGNPSDHNKLDLDNTGIACQIVPVPYKNVASDKTPVAEAKSAADLNCDDFEYQQEAQMVYLRDQSDPNDLDDNDDGLACEKELQSLASNQEAVHAASSIRPLSTTTVPGGPDSWLPIAGFFACCSALGLVVWQRSRSRAG